MSDGVEPGLAEQIAQQQLPVPRLPDPEHRRLLCLQTAMGLVVRGMLLVWETVDYAKYLEDYLAEGKVPLEPKALKPKRTNH